MKNEYYKPPKQASFNPKLIKVLKYLLMFCIWLILCIWLKTTYYKKQTSEPVTVVKLK